MIKLDDFRDDELQFENVNLSKVFDENLDNELNVHFDNDDISDASLHHAQGYDNFCKRCLFDINGTKKEYFIINDLLVSLGMSDNLYNNIVENYNGLTPIEDLFYSYENELKGSINSADDLEALLLSGELISMGKLLGVPSWVLHDIQESYDNSEKSSDKNKLCIAQYLVADYDDFLKAIPYAYQLHPYGLGYSERELAEEVMDILVKADIPLYMISEVKADIPSLDENYIDIKDFPSDIKPMGTINNLNDFDYKPMVDKLKKIM